MEGSTRKIDKGGAEEDAEDVDDGKEEKEVEEAGENVEAATSEGDAVEREAVELWLLNKVPGDERERGRGGGVRWVADDAGSDGVDEDEVRSIDDSDICATEGCLEDDVSMLTENEGAKESGRTDDANERTNEAN